MVLSVLLAACLRAPWFSGDPIQETCGTWHSPVDPNCCSETLWWDPVPEATYYQVQRTSPGGTEVLVGEQWARQCFALDEETDSICMGWEETPFWVPAWDCTRGRRDSNCIFPRHLDPGETYSYRVRACNAGGCSAWTPAVQYARSNEWVWCDPRDTPACRIACWPIPAGGCPAAW